jgi:hypothetical protein
MNWSASATDSMRWSWLIVVGVFGEFGVTDIVVMVCLGA